jgi:hypothetical protein
MSSVLFTDQTLGRWDNAIGVVSFFCIGFVGWLKAGPGVGTILLAIQ